MKERRNLTWTHCRYMGILPMAALALTAFARPSIPPTVNEKMEVCVNDTSDVDDLLDVHLNGRHAFTGEVYSTPEVDVTPKFPGGSDGLKRYVRENLEYPEEAIEDGFQGTVTVEFIILKNGSIAGVNVVKGLHPALDKEAIRIIENMPKWTPGKRHGKKVNVKVFLPVYFQMI